MSSRFRDADAFKKSFQSALADWSRATGLPSGRIQKSVIRERFLARIARVEPGVVVKGGVALELRVPSGRSTLDLDLVIPGDADHVLRVLQKASILDLGDFLSFAVTLDERARSLVRGIVHVHQFKVSAHLVNVADGFNIDVLVGSTVLGPTDQLPSSKVLERCGIATPDFRALSVGEHIADKLHAYTRIRGDGSRPNSRVLDLPDILMLAGSPGPMPIEARSLLSTIRATFDLYAEQPVPVAVPDPPDGWERSYPAIASRHRLPWVTLPVLMRELRDFLDPVLAGGTGSWARDRAAWESED